MTSGPADDPFDRLGVRGTPGRLLVLTAAVALTALAAAAVGLTLPTGCRPTTRSAVRPASASPSPSWPLAQLARLRFRSAAGMVSVTWGEAALIVCLYLAPAGWLPAATLLGAGLAWTMLSLHDDRRPAAGDRPRSPRRWPPRRRWPSSVDHRARPAAARAAHPDAGAGRWSPAR